jgi:hypothetical protein
MYRGMVLVHRDGELAGPFQAEDLAREFRLEIEGTKRHVLARLKRYGVIDYLRSSGKRFAEAYSRLMLAKQLLQYYKSSRSAKSAFILEHFGDLQAEWEIVAALENDLEFAANPWYWTVSDAIVQELGRQDET